MVLFVSFMGKNFNDSPKVLYDYMQNQTKLKKNIIVYGLLNILKIIQNLKQ